MPTYEYACTSCGEHLEVVQSFRDDPLTACPACSGPLRKVFGSIGVVFKGSGFYKTDSRSASRSSKPAASSDTKSKDSSSTAKSSEGSSGSSSAASGSSNGSGSSKSSSSKSSSSKSSSSSGAAAAS
ncbi:MAG: FmdB family zinc ribbon protein [Acidimicrobiales bacterium]